MRPARDERIAPARLRLHALWIFVGLAAGLGYTNAVRDGLVHDDKFFFPRHEIGAREVAGYFTRDSWEQTGVRSHVYRPLLLSSLALDRFVHGKSPKGFHLTNVLLHVAATLLLFGLLRAVLARVEAGARTAARDVGAAVGSLVFAVHPIHAEAVNSILNRSEILGTCGVLGALWTWVVYCRKPHAGRLAAMTGLYFAALLCKESAATLPGLAALHALCVEPGGSGRERVRRLLPLLALLVPLAVYLVLRQAALGSLLGEGALASTPWSERLLVTIASLGDSLRMLVFPHPPRAALADYAGEDWPSGLAVHVAMAAAAWWFWRRDLRLLTFGIGFFYLALLPSTRLLTDPSVAVPLAERYLYLPSVALSVILALLAFRARDRWGTAPVFGAGVLACALVAPLTWARSAIWESDVTLFEAEVRVAPTSPDALRLLTGAYLARDRVPEVVALCDGNVRAQERNAKLANHCADAYDRSGRPESAERAYLQAVRRGGIGAVPHANLARLYASQGRMGEAKEHFERAIELERHPSRKLFRRAHMLVRLYPNDRARLKRAREHLREALGLDPGVAMYRSWLAQTERRLGELRGGSPPAR